MPRQGKPKLADRLSKRELVVIAASKLFLADGYGATGMDAIAKEAGVSKATVYSYYGDKSSLFADVMLRMCEEMGGHRQMEGLVGPSPGDTLRAIAPYGLHRVLETVPRQILKPVVAESRAFPQRGTTVWEDGPGTMAGP